MGNNQRGVALITFLLLIAFLSSVVSLYALISFFHFQNTASLEARERAYQTARGGIDLWIGHLRTDAIPIRERPLPSEADDTTTPPEPYDTRTANPWTMLGQMSVGDLDVPGASGKNGKDTVPFDAHTDSWGWGSQIVPGVNTGDTVYLPSLSGDYSDDDYAMFHLVKIRDESGLLPKKRHDDSALATTTQININTGTYEALQSIKMSPDQSDDPQTLTGSMAKSIMERRSSTSISSSPPSVKDENYQTGDPDPFESLDEACTFLEGKHGNFNCGTFARHARIDSEGLFMVEIIGAATPESGVTKGSVRLKALIDRREFMLGKAPVKILSITE